MRWHCGPCSARYQQDVEQSNRLPSKPDLFVVGGRDHVGMRDKVHLKKHEESDYHDETIKKMADPEPAQQEQKPQAKL